MPSNYLLSTICKLNGDRIGLDDGARQIAIFCEHRVTDNRVIIIIIVILQCCCTQFDF